jgi:hypothetical protein
MAQAGRSPGGRGHEPRVEVEAEVSPAAPTLSCRHPAEAQPCASASAPWAPARI